MTEPMTESPNNSHTSVYTIQTSANTQKYKLEVTLTFNEKASVDEAQLAKLVAEALTDYHDECGIIDGADLTCRDNEVYDRVSAGDEVIPDEFDLVEVTAKLCDGPVLALQV